jgi:hypothetical protein
VVCPWPQGSGDGRRVPRRLHDLLHLWSRAERTPSTMSSRCASRRISSAASRSGAQPTVFVDARRAGGLQARSRDQADDPGSPPLTTLVIASPQVAHVFECTNGRGSPACHLLAFALDLCRSGDAWTGRCPGQAGLDPAGSARYFCCPDEAASHQHQGQSPREGRKLPVLTAGLMAPLGMTFATAADADAPPVTLQRCSQPLDPMTMSICLLTSLYCS